MLSPEDEAQARADADLHALLRIASSAPTRTQPGACLLFGELLRVTRGPADIAAGAHIALWVDSRWRDQRCPPGDDLRLDLESLQPGALLEFHAKRQATDRFQVHHGQARLLDPEPPR